MLQGVEFTELLYTVNSHEITAIKITKMFHKRLHSKFLSLYLPKYTEILENVVTFRVTYLGWKSKWKYKQASVHFSKFLWRSQWNINI